MADVSPFELLGKVVSGFLSALPTAAPAAAPVAAAPVAVPVAAPVVASLASPTSLGLKLLLEPNASSIFFRASCNAVGVLYPAYASFKAIETKKTDDDTQWLTYWTIYGAISLAEYYADNLNWVPYYYHAKLLLLLWLQNEGAKLVYLKYARPLLIKYQPKIDIGLAKLYEALGWLYATYKVPLDALHSAALLAVAQVKAFFKWLNSPEGSSKGPIKE